MIGSATDSRGTKILGPAVSPVAAKKTVLVVDDSSLVVEILSESTRERDLDLKKKLYARHGVKEYWIADPDARTVTVYLLQGDGYMETGTYGPDDTWRPHVLPGLEVRGAEVFD